MRVAATGKRVPYPQLIWPHPRWLAQVRVAALSACRMAGRSVGADRLRPHLPTLLPGVFAGLKVPHYTHPKYRGFGGAE